MNSGIRRAAIARSRRKSLLFPTIMTTAALLIAPATVAHAAPGPSHAALNHAALNHATLGYAALGDSVSSGEGAPPFDPAAGFCDRSLTASYPVLFAGQRHAAPFTSVACSGATTTDVLNTQLGALDLGTDLVTITIGANDVGFSAIVRTCTVSTSDADCDQVVHRGEIQAVTTLPLRLARTYAAIHRAAPHARIVVLGYERLFETTAACADPYAPDQHRRITLNQGADLLDGVIAATARASGLRYVDVRPAFAGHGLCAPESWINGPELGLANGAYHPTAFGYAHGYLPPLLAATD